MERNECVSSFICPICGTALERKENCLVCKKKHSFDLHKSGYCNLLMSQQIKAKRHGDDKMMVKARQDFLEKGFYNPLCNKLCELVLKYTKKNAIILDAGCGEGFYTAKISQTLAENQKEPCIFGIDISKDALTAAAKRIKDMEFSVASVFKLPVANDYCDIVLSVFAPVSESEFLRVLKNNGIFIKAFPLQKHLWELKEAIYDNPYENEAENEELKGFTLIEKPEIKTEILLESNTDIKNLFSMTPYYYKTSEKDQKKLENLQVLKTETEFGIIVYNKNK